MFSGLLNYIYYFYVGIDSSVLLYGIPILLLKDGYEDIKLQYYINISIFLSIEICNSEIQFQY